MLEPVTIFSLCLTAINIILNTIPSLIDKAEQIKNYQRRFTRYVECLENALNSLRWWDTRWKQNDLQDYLALFGKAGWKTISQRRDNIWDLLNNILGHLDLEKVNEDDSGDVARSGRIRDSGLKGTLRSIFSSTPRRTKEIEQSSKGVLTESGTGSNNLTKEERRAWQIYFHNKAGELEAIGSERNVSGNKPTKNLGKPDITVMTRIIGLLYMNQQLDHKIGELEDAIGRLHAFSRDCWFDMGHGTTSSDPIRADVDQSLEREKIQSIAEEVYQSCLKLRGSSQWRLELRADDDLDEDEQALSVLARKGTLFFGVAYRQGLGRPLLIQELIIKQLSGQLSTASGTDTSLDAAMRASQSPSSLIAASKRGPKVEIEASSKPRFSSPSLRHILQQCVGSDQLQMTFMLERARIAYRCTLWIILLWKTDWFSHLCACGLHTMIFQPQTYIEMFSDRPSEPSPAQEEPRREYVFRSHGWEADDHPCSIPYSSSDKLYLLGILLAEILMSQPIDLEKADGQLRLKQGQPMKTNADIIRHLERYRFVGKRNPAIDAVEFCLNNATNRSWQTSQQSLSKHQFQLLIDHVLTPVRKYLTLVKQNWTPRWSKRLISVSESMIGDSSWNCRHDQILIQKSRARGELHDRRP